MLRPNAFSSWTIASVNVSGTGPSEVDFGIPLRGALTVWP